MNEKEIEILEQNKQLIKSEYREKLNRAIRILHISSELPKPKGWIRKRCPKCNSYLNHEIIENIILYRCNCGYEYALNYVPLHYP